ncbi:DUF3168 domain-containing protein [Oceaniglobus trochenteri]|uniref:DUF3168 domain-containing protein n=1 Tax=Oceaniglobus trochenteri TaxID=2763260 RepID=UPI001CFF999D|nr:DUF3168 domain-containing protein [Oceaniglobus trochenteri]
MADGYALALQAGIVAALKADGGVTALVGDRVYDEPPKKPTFPYIRVGNIEPRPLRTDCGAAADVALGLEVYSRPKSGRVECTRIAEAVVAALDERESSVVVVGFDLVSLQWMTQTVGRDSDGESYLAIIAFSALIDG